MRITAAAAILLALSASSAVRAMADDTTACATTDTGLPPEFAAWPSKAPIAAASNAAGAARAKITAGKAYTAALTATPAISYVAQPGKPGDPASSGGLFTIDVPSAGTYVVALGGGAWIDVLNGTSPVTSTAHGHGPACSTIRKVVDFPLTPGRYTIQLAGSASRSLAVMVARRP